MTSVIFCPTATSDSPSYFYVYLLLSHLGGRTWDSSEELSESLADIVKSAPDIVRVNMVVREVREEKVEYKIIALEYTRQLLRELVVTEKLRRVVTAVEDGIK